MPAKAGIQARFHIQYNSLWIPACAGMTVNYLSDKASIPGNFLPSRNSSEAPPPVDI
jgi:hypothetical protein